jgi:hypothetical protein
MRERRASHRRRRSPSYSPIRCPHHRVASGPLDDPAPGTGSVQKTELDNVRCRSARQNCSRSFGRRGGRWFCSREAAMRANRTGKKRHEAAGVLWQGRAAPSPPSLASLGSLYQYPIPCGQRPIRDEPSGPTCEKRGCWHEYRQDAAPLGSRMGFDNAVGVMALSDRR